MASKRHSRTLNSYSSEDNSDSEYKIEEESSEESEEQSKSNNNSSKKRIKRRVLEWEEEDEIIVLQQLYQFGGSNASYSKAFYEFVKKRLNNNQVSMHQLSNKIDRFKKEYLKNECRKKENDLKFSEYHEFEVFMLSRRIWGGKRSKSNGGRMKYAKGFLEYLEEMDIDIDCLTPSCLEHFKKEWEVQLLMYIELLSKKSKFDAKLMELLFTKSSHPN
ncbi:probable transcription factor At1g66420 [Cucurbita moschata]|uniref:Probable transcription factor At1g66420 n=1 Tax=Cucurbita moschata TaxID=3662 RepID=A0A6J1GK86_CUCMO|nr:probable transcription factor At1g66420 [Cucurbita moschata]